MIREKKIHLAKIISVIFIVFAIIAIICISYYSFLGFDLGRYETMPLDAKGQVGDSWGMFTSIFSALAFGGVVVTLALQANVLADNKYEMKKQEDKYEKQRFEDIVFRMLTIQSDIINGMRIVRTIQDEPIVVGRDVFRVFFYEFRQYYSVRNRFLANDKRGVGNDHWFDEYLAFCEFNGGYTKTMVKSNDDLKELNVIGYSYETFMKMFRDELGHYFRFIYNIFKFIDESIVSEDDKIKYSKIIRAQLSDYELIIIFYNCLTWRGCESFKTLVEKYNIFDNIPFDLLIEHEHMRHYEMTAFDGKTSYFVGN